MTALPPRPDLPPILVARGLLTREQVDEANARGGEGGKFAEVVVGLGLITEDQIHFAVSGETGLPYLHLHPDMVDREVVARFPAGSLVRHGVVPLLEDPDELCVAMVDPWDAAALELLSRHTTKPLNISLAARGNVSETLRAVLGRQSAEVEATAVAIEDTTGIALVYQQLLGAAAENAEEIHFDTSETSLRVRFRAGGRLVQKATLPGTMALPVFTRLKVLAGVDPFHQQEYRKSGIRSQLAGKDFEVSYAFTPTEAGGSAVVTLSPAAEAGGARTAAEVLGDEALASRVVADLARSGSLVGLGVPRAATEASGLLAALLSRAASSGAKVVWVGGGEAAGVITLGGAAGASSLDRALALAPDLIAFSGDSGLEMALEAAAAGPCALTELSHRRAADVLAHLLSLEPGPRVRAAACVSSLVAVRSAAELCASCKRLVDPAGKEGLAVLADLDDRTASALTASGWYHAAGCDACKMTGRSGRVLLPERVCITARARAALREGRLDDALERARWDGPALSWLASGRIGVEELG